VDGRLTGKLADYPFFVHNSQTEFPHPGVAVRTNPHGIKLVFLHYSADPTRATARRRWCPRSGWRCRPGRWSSTAVSEH